MALTYISDILYDCTDNDISHTVEISKVCIYSYLNAAKSRMLMFIYVQLNAVC